jgi:hypothetical protein
LTSKKLPKSKTGFRERKAVKEFNQSGRYGRGNKRKKNKIQENRKITRKTKFLETKSKIKAKSRRVEKQAHTARKHTNAKIRSENTKRAGWRSTAIYGMSGYSILRKVFK